MEPFPEQISDTYNQDLVSAAKGSGIIFIGGVYEFAGRFLFGLLLARFMGAEQYGIYGLAHTIVTVIVAMAVLGLDVSLVHYIPIFRNRSDDNSLWGIILIGMLIPLLAGTICGITVLNFADLIAHFLNEPKIVSVLPIVALAIPLTVILYTAASATVGFKRVRYRVIAQEITLTSAKLILVIPVALIGLNVVRAMAVHTVGTMIAGLLGCYFLYRIFPFNRPFRTARVKLREVFGFSLAVYFSQLFEIVGWHLQIILLSVMSNAMAIGIFLAAFRISMIGNLFYSSITTVIMPYVSDLYSRKEWKQLGYVYRTITKWTFSFYLPIFLIILLFPRAILSVFGESFVLGVNELVLLSIANLIMAGTGISGVMITMTGRPWLNTINSVLVLGVTLGLCIWLIPGMGSVGAALAQTGGVAVGGLARLLQVFVLYGLLPYNRTFLKPIGAGIITFMATYLLNSLIPTRLGFMGFVFSAFFLLSVYTLMIFIMKLDKDDRLIFALIVNRLEPWVPKSLKRLINT